MTPRLVFAMATIMVSFCIVWIYVSSSVQNVPINSECYNMRDNMVFIPHGKDVGQEIPEYIAQRNNISRLLNLKQKINAQNECKKSNDTSSTGGWCNKTKTQTTGIHVTDELLIPVLAVFFARKSVGSFGDGPGIYKQMLTETGKLKSYDAYDGAPFSEYTTQGRVQFLDLTLPQYGLPLYDWIISLEVAEHIPIKYESIFIDNVVRHAKEGVVLSWAVPGQIGFQHVNNRPFDYVVTLMDKLGFSHDPLASEVLKNAASKGWIKRNINVYRRKNATDTFIQSLLLNA